MKRITLALFVMLTFAGSALAATSVGLGTADSYAVLAEASITNVGSTTLNGDPGLWAGTAVVRAPVVTGSSHVGATPIAGPGLLGGLTLTPGVYNSGSSIGLTGTVTLNGGGDPNAVFSFPAGSTLITEVNSRVVLTNGTQACNAFWQVGSSVGSVFRGTILTLQDSTVQTNVVVDGRVLTGAAADSVTGALTRDSDVREAARSQATSAGLSRGSAPARR